MWVCCWLGTEGEGVDVGLNGLWAHQNFLTSQTHSYIGAGMQQLPGTFTFALVFLFLFCLGPRSVKTVPFQKMVIYNFSGFMPYTKVKIANEGIYMSCIRIWP